MFKMLKSVLLKSTTDRRGGRHVTLPADRSAALLLRDRFSKTGRKHLCCSSCKTVFYYTSIELAFYISKELSPPDICRVCRKYGAPEVQASILVGKIVNS